MVIEFKPVFGTPYDVNEKLAFVLMPFNDVGLNNIYENIVKPTVQSKGLECLRANDYQTNEVIMDEDMAGNLSGESGYSRNDRLES